MGQTQIELVVSSDPLTDLLTIIANGCCKSALWKLRQIVVGLFSVNGSDSLAQNVLVLVIMPAICFRIQSDP